MPNKILLKVALFLTMLFCASLVYSQTAQNNMSNKTSNKTPEKKGSAMSNNTSPKATLRIVAEKEATLKYDLKKQMSSLFGSWQYESHLKNYFFLVADGDLEINGNLRLDYDDGNWATDSLAWRKSLNIADDENLKNNYGIRGVIVTGNLTVNGSIKNSDMESGPFLLVMGNVAAHNLVAGGAHMVVNGNATIRDVAYGHYNDGSIDINGDLSVPIFINEDHSFSYKSLKNNKFKYNSHNDSIDEDVDGNPKIPKKLRTLIKDAILDWDDFIEAIRGAEDVLKQANDKNAAAADNDWVAILQRDGNKLHLVPKDALNAEFCQIAVANDGMALKKVPAKLLTQQMIETALIQNSTAIAYVPKKWLTQDIARLAIKNRASLREVPAELIDADMATFAVSDFYQNMSAVPAHLVTRDLLAAYFTNQTKQAYDLQIYFRKPQDFQLEDIVLQVAKISLEKFDEIPPMYVTETVYKTAESLYKNDPAWNEVCHKHSKAAWGGDLSKSEIKGLINNDGINNMDDANYKVADALDNVWAYQIDSNYIAKLMQVTGENFQGASNISHNMMTPGVIDAMLANSTTHIQYLPHNIMTENLALRVVNDWHTNLDCIAEEFRSLIVCQAALKRCKIHNDYLIDEVIAAIPEVHKAALGLA
jgi:hypothetical protein